MTQDQRYDMITEMYEATRYAKEMHKKAEKEGDKANAIGREMENAPNETIYKAMQKKMSKHTKSYMDADEKDSIGYANKDFKDSGRKAAKKQPGRYEKHEERKPGTYLRMQKSF